MNKESIYDGLVAVLEREFDIPSDTVSQETKLYEDLRIDSFDAADLLEQLKKLTGRQMSEEVFARAKTVGDVVDAVYAHLKVGHCKADKKL